MKNIFTKFKFNIELLEVKYSSLPKISGDLGVIVEDNNKIEGKSSDSIKIIFTREVKLNPNAGFEIEVKYLIVMLLNADNKEDVNKENYQSIIDFLNDEKNIIKVINKSNVISKASTIIANLTTYNNFNPLITPPIYFNTRNK